MTGGRIPARPEDHSEAVMPLIRVAMFPGRTAEQKQALAEELTEAFLRTCGGNREGLWVIIDEVPREHWAVGGKLRSAPADSS